MKAEEKALLFDFFKTTDSLLLKGNSEFFSKNFNFSDDLTIEEYKEENAASVCSINTISEKIGKCRNCSLCETRKNTVPGVGVENPLVLVIGEGPGEMEDLKGEPFVGKAGELLDKMLASISLSRKTNCFITNIVKCRPPNNRDPEPEESSACDAFLQAQIAVLKPKAILILGSPAVRHILKTASGITSMRGKFYDVKGIPAIATYHPSALLRDPSKKMDAWTDLKSLYRLLAQNK